MKSVKQGQLEFLNWEMGVFFYFGIYRIFGQKHSVEGRNGRRCERVRRFEFIAVRPWDISVSVISRPFALRR